MFGPGPKEIFDNQPQPMEPYYVLMQLPDSEELDFIQILPFTPANRENMIAWLAAKNDPVDYGKKLVYEFGKDTLFYGPKQIEARIDQDPVISQQISLWDQAGSNVIRGNLLVIPIGESLIYVEPLYLQAENGQIPELKQVILATANRVVMAENLGLALAQLLVMTFCPMRPSPSWPPGSNRAARPQLARQQDHWNWATPRWKS
ncbi:MAG: UPF0182 family protein [Caldilineaceae bacterium]